MALVFAVMNLHFFFFFNFASGHSFYYTFLNLVLVNRRNGPRYQRVLALCAFFNRGDAEGTSSSKILFDVCVCFVLCNLCQG